MSLSASLLGSELEALGRILNPVAPGEERLRDGENRFVAILFMDLKGFTELGERLHSEDVQQILDRVLTVFTNSIEKYSGYIDKYEGDLIMALFGSRNASEQDTERALLAGLKMLRDLPEVNRLLGTQLAIRIGVNTGLVTTGRVGKKREGDFTVYGDAVNVASRMESHAPLDSILITEETRELVKDRFEFTDRGELTVKGKSRPLRVYTVDRALERPPLALGAEADTAFIGRGAELDVLASGWNTCCRLHRNGTLQTFEITAPAGLGKTRLVREFLLRLTGSGSALVPVPLRVSPGPAGSGAGGLWRSLLCQLFPLGENPEGEPARRALAGAVDTLWGGGEETATVCARRTSLLGLLFGLPWPEAHTDPATLASQLAICVRHLLEELALRSDQPLALICEDLDRADELSRSLLEHLVDNWNRDREPGTPRGGLFLLILHRGEELASLAARDTVESLRLPPLSDPESLELLRLTLDGSRLPDGLGTLLLPRAQGNPLVLRELLALLRERDLLVCREGAWLLRDESRQLPLPHGLNQLLLSRVDLLPAGLKLGLQCAAVLGGPVERGLLEECLARLEAVGDPGTIVPGLLRGGWLKQDGHGRLSFVSSLVGDVCYTTLLRHNRRLIHGLAARVAGESAGQDPDRLAWVARHVDEADQPAQALDWLGRAWLAGAAVADPRRRLELGLRLKHRLETVAPDGGPVSRAHLALELAGLQEGLGQWGEALETLDSVSGPGTVEGPDARVLRGRLLALLGDKDGAQAVLKQALETAGSNGDTTAQGRVLAELARLARIRGHLPQAIAQYEEALLRLPLDGSPSLRADCLMGLGSCRRAVGDSAGSLEALAAARRIFSALGDLRGLSGCLQSEGDLARLAGERGTARTYYQEALSHSLSLGLREREAAVRRSLGDLLLLADEREAAAAELAASLALFGELGDLHGRAVVLRSQGHLKRLSGDTEGAASCFGQSRDLRRVLGDARGEAFALADLAQLASAANDLDGAIRLTEEALELFRVQGQRTAVAKCLLLLGDYRAQRGLAEAARPCYHEASALFEAQQDQRGRALCVLGLAECDSGPLDPGVRRELETLLPRLAGLNLAAAGTRARQRLARE